MDESANEDIPKFFMETIRTKFHDFAQFDESSFMVFFAHSMNVQRQYSFSAMIWLERSVALIRECFVCHTVVFYFQSVILMNWKIFEPCISIHYFARISQFHGNNLPRNTNFCKMLKIVYSLPA